MKSKLLFSFLISLITITAYAGCNFNVTNVTTNGTVASFTVGQGNWGPRKYVWDFGDGQSGVSYSNSIDETYITHNYNNTGVYTLTITSTDTLGGGCVSWITYNLSLFGNNTPCVPSFSVNTDTSCVSHFTNGSTGFNLTYEWREMVPSFPLLSTQQNPDLNLSFGLHYIVLYTYSNGVFCDTIGQEINITCNDTTTPIPCQATALFDVFADSMNTGNYFAYNMSSGTGPLSYLWDFGDGSTSNQPYPFHQYGTPGNYIICLTVSASSGTTTCSDTYCDSSSVQRISAGALMSQFSVIPQATGIKQLESNNNVLIYPNPIESELTIIANEDVSYTLSDALGRIICSGLTNQNNAIINTENLAKGFYSLRIANKDGNKIKSIKLIK